MHFVVSLPEQNILKNVTSQHFQSYLCRRLRGGMEITMENTSRNFVKIIREICLEENIELKSFSYDWIFQLSKNNKNNFIIGYQFGLNSASVHSICCDKSAASEIMTSLNIPNVEHYFFMAPTNQKYISETGNWNILKKKLEKYGQLVCKTNEGSGGNLVFRANNQYELEKAVYKIFQKSHSMAISPYYNIDNEYRAVVLDGKIKLLYSKQRQYVTGDGIHSIGSLIFEYLSKEENKNANIKLPDDDLTKIINKGERFEFNWKHNLGQGAKATIVQNQDIKTKIEAIVQLVVNRMNVRFASIDVVNCNGCYKILEINSGVMLEHFSQQDNRSYRIAKEIYKEAIKKMFI